MAEDRIEYLFRRKLREKKSVKPTAIVVPSVRNTKFVTKADEISFNNKQHIENPDNIATIGIYVPKKIKYIKQRKYYKVTKYSKKDLLYLLSILNQNYGGSEYCTGAKSCSMPYLRETEHETTLRLNKINSVNMGYNSKSNFVVNNCGESRQDGLGAFIHPLMHTKVYRCQLNMSTKKDICCCRCNSDAMFEVMKGLYDCYMKKNCDNCKCIICCEKQRSCVESKKLGADIDAKKVTKKPIKEKELVKSASEIEKGRASPRLSGGTMVDKKFEVQHSLPLSESQIVSEKEMTEKVITEKGKPKTVSEQLKVPKKKEKDKRTKKAKTEGLGLQETARDLDKQRLPRLEGKIVSEKKMTEKVKKEKRKPAKPKTVSEQLKVPKQKEKNKKTKKTETEGLGLQETARDLDKQRLEGKIVPEKKMTEKVRKEKKKPAKPKTVSEPLKVPKQKEKNKTTKKAKTEGIVTPFDLKTLFQKEKVLRDLAKQGLPFPECLTVSENKLIDKIRKEIGYPTEPKTMSQKIRLTKAHAEGIITPLEGKTASQKAVALRKMVAAGVPLPVGRTPSEKSLIASVKETARVSSERLRITKAEGLLTPLEHSRKSDELIPLKLPKQVSKSKIPSKKLKEMKSAGLLTPLEGKSTERKEKILRGLAMNDVPLPVAKTPSEKKIIDKVRRDLGLPPEPRTSTESLRYKKAAAKGLITPLEEKSSAQKDKILRGLAETGVPLPEGRTPSEKALIGKIKTMTPANVKDTDSNSSERLRKTKTEGLLTPLEDKSLAEKEIIFRKLHQQGLPLPEPKTASEKKLIKKINKEEVSKKPENITKSEKAIKAKKGAKASKPEKEIKSKKETKMPKTDKTTKPLQVKTSEEKLKERDKEKREKEKLEKEKKEKEKKEKDKKDKEKQIEEKSKKAKAEKKKKKDKKEKETARVPSNISSERLRKEKAEGIKAHAEGIVTPLEGKTDLQKEVALRKMIAAGVPLPEGRTLSEKTLIERLRKAKAEGLLTPLEEKTLQKEKTARDLDKHKKKKTEKVGKEKKKPAKPKTVSEQLKVPKQKEKNKSQYTGEVIEPRVNKKSRSVTTTAVGAGIRGEIEEIPKTTSCDKSCGCDKKKIRFKHSYVKIRVTSPDISSLCDCPGECIPGVQSGVLVGNEGIKVTVGRVTGFPSYVPKSPRYNTLLDSRYVSSEQSFISLYQNVLRNSYLNILKDALCKNLYEIYKAKMNHTWKTKSSVRRYASESQESLKKVYVYNTHEETHRLFYDRERSYVSSVKYADSAHIVNRNESTLNSNVKSKSYDSILIMRTESTLSLSSNTYSELGTVTVTSFLGSTFSTNDSSCSQSLTIVSNSDMDADPYFQDLYCSTTNVTLR